MQATKMCIRDSCERFGTVDILVNNAGICKLNKVLDWLTNPWEPYKRGIMIGFDSSMDYAWIRCV